jgi:hypothetical protein
MAITVQDSGTQTAVIGTEHTVEDAVVNGTFVFVVDTSNMANGDQLELAVKTRMTALGTTRVAYKAGYAHAQAELIKHSIPLATDTRITATIKQTAGTGRNYDWKVLRIDT